jgi:hypothetical protein
MWGKYCKISRICNNKTKSKKQCFIKRYNQYAKINYLIALPTEDKMKNSI